MKKVLSVIILSFLTFQLYAADYYWVGGGGNWSDLNHWRLNNSAGPVPSIVPSAGDNVFFDANSGFGATPATRTITLDANGFCNNMTWTNVPNNPIFNTANASFTVEVWGSMSLSPTTSYTCIFKFKGATSATIATNGTVQGAFGFEIDKPGSSLTVTDSLIVPSLPVVPTSYIILTAGTFNIAGKKVNHIRFSSENSNARVLDMTNADVTFSWYYNFQGTNKTLHASGSTLVAGGWIYMDGGTYPRVFNDAYADNSTISNTTMGSLTFRSTGAPLSLGVNDGNTIDSLISMGAVSIGSNNNINQIIAAGGVSAGNNNQVDTITGPLGVTIGSTNTISRVISGGNDVMGAGNTIGYWQNGGQFTVNGTGTNNVDSLLLTPGKAIRFSGTFNINKYLKLDGTTCDAFSEVSGDSTAGSLNFASGAMATMNNMILTGLKAYGSITPLAVAGIDNGGNAGFTITPPAAGSATLYWVGGSGDWNDRGHWSTTSGGAAGACVPYIGDNVVFDANSGLSTSGTITTSSSAFCNNMTWSDVGNVTFNESGSFKFSMYGSLVMDNTVTMNALIEMTGSANASITTNGSTAGGLQFIIVKTGSGVVTLADNWSNSSGGSFVHRSGGLNLSGRTVSLVYYSSSINATRSLDISNATLNFTQYWDYRGTGKTLNAAGSHITSAGGFGSNGGMTYPLVDITGAAGVGPGFPIDNTTIGQLTFTNTSATSTVHVSGSLNNIRRLEFKGKGSVLGTNSIDSLILAGSRNYAFSGTTTINNYMLAQSATCAGLSEIKGSPTGTLAFAGGADVDIANVYLQNMTATGTPAQITVNGADAGGNSGWIITSAASGDRYWVGGSGDWNDPAHWSATSGGTPGSACVPTVYDDVYFDAGSGFTTASKTVTINNGNAYCQNMDWTGALNNPIFNKSASFNLEIWGNLVMNPAVTMNAAVSFTGPGNKNVTSNGAALGNLDINILKPSGSAIVFQDNYNNPQTRINLRSGTLDLSSRTITCEAISDNLTTTPTALNVTDAIITGAWSYLGSNKSLQSANSKLIASFFEANGGTYNMVDVTTTNNAWILISSTTLDSLVFSNSSTVSGAEIEAGNTINYLEFKDRGAINGTGNTINTLVFFPGKIYTFGAGTNTTITGEWYASGTPCSATEIVSGSTTNATITKTSGNVSFDYVRLRRITAAGAAAPFAAGSHSTDLGNNTNWNIAPYDGAASIHGLGADTAMFDEEFPYVLRTDGFYGAPSSTYLWSDNSTADTLLVTGPGTYSISVIFSDGCNINDQITITSNGSLPITLTSFTANARECRAKLDWKVEDAVNFSHFVVEKSKDGSNFISTGQVLYTKNVNAYSFTDGSLSSGTTFYRLRLVDIDGAYNYSSIASVYSTCNAASIQVYPTVTTSQVKVTLPEGYENARLQVVNTWGQRVAPVVQVAGSLRTINLEKLPAGTYLVQIINGTEMQNFKVIKQ